MQIMELLWQADGPVTFREIMDISATEWGKSWKVQTLSTYLITLQKMGLVDSERSGCSNAYQAVCSKEEHIHNWTRKLVETCFDNSFSRLLWLLWEMEIIEGRCGRAEKVAISLKYLEGASNG